MVVTKVSVNSLIAKTNNSCTYFGECICDGLTVPIIVKRLDCESDDLFLREVEALKYHDYPGFVKMLGYDNSKNEIYLKKISGPLFSNYIEDKYKLAPEEAICMFTKMAESLQLLHHGSESKPSFIHYDISDRNFILDENNDPILIDFGTSYMKNQIPSSYHSSMIGTLEFMSPEKINMLPERGCESDVYSLGAVFYKALSGMPPFMECLGSIKKQILNDSPIPIDSGNSDLDHLVMSCLSKSSSDRPSSEELCNYLSKLY